jgi:hypothetical protein
MMFKPGQLVMKVRQPEEGKQAHVPLRAVGEYLSYNPNNVAEGMVPYPHRCHWPSMVGYTGNNSDGKGNWFMKEGTIIPLNDPDFKGEDTDADVHSRRPIKESAC